MAKKPISANAQITGISLDENAKKHKVKTTFSERVATLESEQEEEIEKEELTAEEDAEELFAENEYQVKAKYMPHKDYLAAMAKLTKYALEICEIEDEAKNNYFVGGFKIQGDMKLKQSRITMTLCKHVQRTDKVIKWTTPQVSMYGKSDYEKAASLTKAVEECLSEAWAYISGKYGDQAKGQLPLFERAMRIAA